MAGNPNSPPVIQEAALDDNGNFSPAWYRWFTSVVAPSLQSPVSSAAPAAHNSVGTPGQIATDGLYVYICVGKNSWTRAPLSAF